MLRNIAVDPDGRAGGSVALLAFAEDAAEEPGLSTLRLYTNVAMAENLTFYLRLRYEEVNRRTDNGCERVFFVKHLP